MTQLELKTEKLKGILASMGRVVIGFSGGVDSTLLLYAAKETLSAENVLAVTAVSAITSPREREDAIFLAKQNGIEHILFNSQEINEPYFRANTENRCYLCKKSRFSSLVRMARKRSIDWVLDGENADDHNDYRPGSIACRELGVRSPLKEAQITKKEVRAISKNLGLATWDKPANACLASRIPYGTDITEEKLYQVDMAEAFISDSGLGQQVRVRHHGNIARIELLPENISKLLDESIRKKIVDRLTVIGFSFVTLDLEGYRMGSLNRLIETNLKEENDKHR